MHRVAIIGGGFGGLNAARQLAGRKDVAVTLVDKRNFHLFQPLLYQVATGSLSPGEIAAPLRSVFQNASNIRVLMAEAVDFDVAGRRVILDEGCVDYDTLILAAGSANSYFGHKEWEAIAPGLKTIEDAVRIRHKILFAFEAAERETDPAERQAWLTFVVVGAGPTGVELAGALGEIANDTLRNEFRSIRPEEARLLLLDGSPRVLPPFPEDLSRAAEQHLIGLGVRTRNNVRVVAIDAGGVEIQSSAGAPRERIASKTVIWAAGVTATPIARKLAERTGAPSDRQGRIQVSADLTVPGHSEIFVIGDLVDLAQDGKPLPGVAPAAMQMGRYAGRAVEARLEGREPEPFRYWDKGNLAVIGRAAAVAQIGRVHLHGLIAWLVWLFVHLMYIVQFQSRVLVFIQWGFEYLTFNRGARLITGPGADETKPPA